LAYVPPKFRITLPESGIDAAEAQRAYSERIRASLAEQLASDEQLSELKSIGGKKYGGWSISAHNGMLSGCHVEVIFNPQRPTAATVCLNSTSRLEDLLQKGYGILLLVAGLAACLYAAIEGHKGILYIAMAILFVAYLAGLLVIAIVTSILRAMFGNAFPNERIDAVASRLREISTMAAGAKAASAAQETGITQQ